MGIASGPSWSIAAVLRLITLINILYNYRRRKLWPPPDFPTLFFALRVFFCFSPSSKRESRFYNSGEFRRLAFLGLYRARLPLQAIACLASRRENPGLPPELWRSLARTNVIENVMGTVRRVSWYIAFVSAPRPQKGWK